MQTPFTIPKDLRIHVTETLGDAGVEWLDQLPERVAAIELEWRISIGQPFPAGEFNFVAPAVRDLTEEVVIKIAPPFPDGEFYSEAAWLRARDGQGAVRLLNVDRDSRAMLIERALPGRNLAEAFSIREGKLVGPAIELLAELEMPVPSDLSNVILLDNWFANLERAVGTEFPGNYVEKALRYYRELSAGSENAYLHGDFHPGNIVTAGRSPYLAIDPKGIVGPVGYDIAVFLNNLHWGQEKEPGARQRVRQAAERFASAFGMKEQEIRRWAFCTQVLGAWWTFDEMPALYSGGVARADIWDV